MAIYNMFEYLCSELERRSIPKSHSFIYTANIISLLHVSNHHVENVLSTRFHQLKGLL